MKMVWYCDKVRVRRVNLEECGRGEEPFVKTFKMEEGKDPAAAVCLGDSAYHRSNVKGELGIERPVSLPKDGISKRPEFEFFFLPELTFRAPRRRK
jgi:hypothetical protein